MKEKISLIQMDVELGQVERNYEKAVQLMELALEDKPDILVLPETLNTGFFPSPDSALYAASDADGVQTKKGIRRICQGAWRQYRGGLGQRFGKWMRFQSKLYL